MTVAELIEFLKLQPQNLQVGFQCFSEYELLQADSIHVEEHAVARPDGWIPRKRANNETQVYLMFPGN